MATRMTPAPICSGLLILLIRPHLAEEEPGERRRDQERHPEPQRIDRQQTDTEANIGRGRGEREDAAQHRADARSPAEGECSAQQERARRLAARETAGEARLTLEERDPDQAREVDAEDDNHPACDVFEDRLVLEQETTHGAGTRAKRHEDRREAEHEKRAQHQRRQPPAGESLLVPQLLERTAGDVGDVPRHQRQDAGRKEGDQPGDEDRDDADGGEFHDRRPREGCARACAATRRCGAPAQSRPGRPSRDRRAHARPPRPRRRRRPWPGCRARGARAPPSSSRR